MIIMIVIITKPHPTWHPDEVHISGFVVRNICDFPPNEWDDDDGDDDDDDNDDDDDDDDDGDGDGDGDGGDDDDDDDDDDDIPYWLSYFPLPLKPPTR